jgi:hypothetical protein
MLVDFPDRDLAVDVRSEPLLSVLLLEGFLPVGGREIEDALRGPAREQAEEVAEVRGGLDLVGAGSSRAARRMRRSRIPLHEARLAAPR